MSGIAMEKKRGLEKEKEKERERVPWKAQPMESGKGNSKEKHSV